MTGLYMWVVTVHVLSAVVWLGSMFSIALAAPTLRSITDVDTRAALFDALGRRFRAVGWICITVLVVTGVIQVQMRGWWEAGVRDAAAFWQDPPGSTLAWKLGLVLIVVAVQAAHDFSLGPRAGAAERGSDAARTLRRWAARLARLNALLAVLLLYFAVRLARGG